MPTINSGSDSVLLPAGQTLRFDAGGDGLASVALPGNNLHFEVGETPRMIGPFRVDVSVSVNAIRPLTSISTKGVMRFIFHAIAETNPTFVGLLDYLDANRSTVDVMTEGALLRRQHSAAYQ